MGNSKSTRSANNHVPGAIIVNEGARVEERNAKSRSFMKRLQLFSFSSCSSTTLEASSSNKSEQGWELDNGIPKIHADDVMVKGSKKDDNGSRRKKKSNLPKKSSSSLSTVDFMECISKMDPKDVARIMKECNCEYPCLPQHHVRFATKVQERQGRPNCFGCHGVVVDKKSSVPRSTRKTLRSMAA